MRLDALESAQKETNRRLDALESAQKETNRRLDAVEEGLKEVRRDIARVDKKVDRLCVDAGVTLASVTDTVGAELKIIKAK